MRIEKFEKHRFAALDSLRGICACLVVLYHFYNSGWISSNPLVRSGTLFVDFLFVLSGFVIASGYQSKLIEGFSIRKFMFLRLGRIYPLHIFVISFMFIMEIMNLLLPSLTPREAFTGSRSWHGLFENIFLLQVFNPPGGLSWNNPAWSIAAEFWVYLLFAGLCILFRGKIVIAAVLLVAMCGFWLSQTPLGLAVSSDLGIVRCFYGFGTGLLAWHFFPFAKAYSGKFGFGVLTMVEICAVLAMIYLVAYSGFAMVCPPYFGLLVVIFSFEKGLLSKLLLTKPMTYLGVLSYSIYLDHAFVQGRLLDALRIIPGKFGYTLVKVLPDGNKSLATPPLVADAITLVMLISVIFCAYLTHRYVEMPARALSRRIVLKPAMAAQPQ